MTAIDSILAMPAVESAKTRGRLGVGTAVLGFVTVAVFGLSLSRSLFDPLGADQAVFQYITDRVVLGERMYADLWEHNTPGIIPFHLAATTLFGDTEMGLRIVDAFWQAATLAAIVLLAGRDGRRWSAGLIAATLYALAYYGYGYSQTAQREGFAVLPLLLMLHGVLSGEDYAGDRPSLRRRVGWHGLAGVMGFVAFAIKPPLGLAYGIVWCWVLVRAWRGRRQGVVHWAELGSLSMSFIACTAAAVLLLIRIDWWDAFWIVLTRKDMPNYIHGPWMVREQVPRVLAAAGMAIATVAAWRLISSRPYHMKRANKAPPVENRCHMEEGRDGLTGETPVPHENPVPHKHQCYTRAAAWMQIVVASVLVAGLLTTMLFWTFWSQMALRIVGVWLPAAGAIAISAWAGRSTAWRLCMLIAGGCFAALLLQGHFSPYRFAPIACFLAYLAGMEIVDAFGRLRTSGATSPAWAVVCVAAVGHLAVGHWGEMMTTVTRSPYVLADCSLAEHYDRMTRSSSTFSHYSTVAETAARVRGLTHPTETIASLAYEPRLLLLSQRPSVHRYFMTHPALKHQFPELLDAITAQRPPVVVARLPKSLARKLADENPSSAKARHHGSDPDFAAIEPPLFDALANYFGPQVRDLQPLYRITDVVGDLCILQRRE